MTVAECELRFGGKEYHSSLGDQFYYWRSAQLDVLTLKAFPRSYEYKLDLLKDVPVRGDVTNWVSVVIDRHHRSFNWVSNQKSKDKLVAENTRKLMT